MLVSRLVLFNGTRQERELTCTGDSSIFLMRTVMIEDSVVGALYQLVLCPSTSHVVQEDVTRCRAKVGTKMQYTRLME